MESGIYKITNRKNNKCYIGSSINIKRKFEQHLYLLRKNKSHSILLQKAFNKYGEENFMFEIIDTCIPKYLFILEQYYVDNVNPDYNICKLDVSVPIGLKMSDETKKKIGMSNKFKDHPNFGWKSRTIEKLDNEGNVIKEYYSLKQYSIDFLSHKIQ